MNVIVGQGHALLFAHPKAAHRAANARLIALGLHQTNGPLPWPSQMFGVETILKTKAGGAVLLAPR
jgi:hypothetical protein